MIGWNHSFIHRVWTFSWGSICLAGVNLWIGCIVSAVLALARFAICMICMRAVAQTYWPGVDPRSSPCRVVLSATSAKGPSSDFVLPSTLDSLAHFSTGPAMPSQCCMAKDVMPSQRNPPSPTRLPREPLLPPLPPPTSKSPHPPTPSPPPYRPL